VHFTNPYRPALSSGILKGGNESIHQLKKSKGNQQYKVWK